MTSRWISLVPSPIVRELDVAEELLGRIVLHEAVAAVNLHAVVGGLHGDLARVQLRHRRLERRPRARGPSGTRRDRSAAAPPRCASRCRPASTESPGTRRSAGRTAVRSLRVAAAPLRTRPAPGRPTSAAMPMRPASSTCSVLTKPCPSSPSSCVGRHAAVLEDAPRSCRSRACRACLPSCPALMPGVPCSTMNAEMPAVPCGAIGDRHDDHHAADAAVRDERLRRR